MSRKIMIIVICCIVIVSMFPIKSSEFVPSNNILYVGGSGPGNYSMIQQAVDAAISGDNIFVYNGIFEEQIYINKSIAIIGQNASNVVINASGLSNGVIISSDAVVLSNVTVTNAMGWYPASAVHVNHSNNVSLFSCHIVNNTCMGLFLDHAWGGNVQWNIFSNNYNQVHIDESTQIRFSNNSFYNHHWGNLYVTGSTEEQYNHTIIDNDISGKPIEYYFSLSDVVFQQRDITHLIIANAENITIEHCDIVNGEGIHFAFVNNSTIQNNHIMNNYQTAILFHYSGNNSISNNTFRDNHRGMDLCMYNHGNVIDNNIIAESGDLGIGMSAYGCNNRIMNNDIHNNSYGVALVQNVDENLSFNQHNLLKNNSVHHNRDAGIRLFGSSQTSIIENNVYANQKDGIQIIQSNQTTIDTNYVHHNGFSGITLDNASKNGINTNRIWSNTADGIRLQYATNNTCCTNVIIGNDEGIVLEGHNTNNTFHANNITENSDQGIFIDQTSHSNIIYNNIFNNPRNAEDRGDNTWNISKLEQTNIIGGPFIGGNYWDNYTGGDINKDGFGDTPASIPVNTFDYLPLVPWTGPLGDMNGDTHLNAADIRYLAMYLNGDPAYNQLHAEGDVNSDRRVNAADVRYLAMYIVGDPAYDPLYP